MQLLVHVTSLMCETEKQYETNNGISDTLKIRLPGVIGKIVIESVLHWNEKIVSRSDTALHCAKFQNDWATDTNVMD